MISGVDHIAIVVSDLDRMAQALEGLGASREGTERHDEVGMEIAFLRAGDTAIELLQPIAETSPIAAERPGIHHVALVTRDAEAAYQQILSHPLYVLDGAVRTGAHGRRIFFFRVKGLEDTLFECVEAA